MRRELAIALRARITWLVAAISALLVGHGFVLAVDLYSAASRSALANALQTKEMDPLAGIVRPSLGGLDLSISLFVPLIAARVLSVEKERRTFGALCLLEGSTDRVIGQKLVAALCAAQLVFVAPVGVFVAYAALGGHLDLIETAWALAGEGLHLALVTAIAVAAAAWTRTFPQAAAVSVGLSLTSWAIDASEGFAALAWLGGASVWSIERQLDPFQRGVASLGAVAWLMTATAVAYVVALGGARFGSSTGRRVVLIAGPAALAATLLFGAATSHRGFDWTEQRRVSLPPEVAERLRKLARPLAIDVFLDRDDSRRRQLESDTLAKLYLARPDLVVRAPLDDAQSVAEARHGEDYGRIVIHVGSSTKETRSTSRREIVTLIFDAAGMPVPAWTQPSYRGFPFVVERSRRTLLTGIAYLLIPGVLLATGFMLTRRRPTR